MSVGQLINGGQTGVDRGAARAAARLRLPIAGWRPALTREQSEEGPLPPMLQKVLKPMEMGGYTERTVANVAMADVLILFVQERLRPDATPGTKKTLELARSRYFVQTLPVDPRTPTEFVSQWLAHISALYPRPMDLMIAGPRKSKWAEGEEMCEKFMFELLDPQERLPLCVT